MAQIDQRFRKMSKIDFQGGFACHLEFSIGSVLAILAFTRRPDAPHQVSTQLEHSL